MFANFDYARLKRSVEYFVEHYACAEFVTPAHRAFDVAIVEFVECTQDFCRDMSRRLIATYRSEMLTRCRFLREYFKP